MDASSPQAKTGEEDDEDADDVKIISPSRRQPDDDPFPWMAAKYIE